ncbi:MAG: PhzF family phenazine biosynthesis protein [Alphaproteobacteria bacterium]|nr:PhzF family phenazine biosynthesis protein [Alphaproteobacteria bacterium]
MPPAKPFPPVSPFPKGCRVSVFGTSAFTGNPATVILDTSSYSDPERQAMARECSTSETIFLGARQADGFPVRFFTPQTEVPSCGHGALAAAYVIETLFGAAALDAGLQSPSGRMAIGKSTSKEDHYWVSVKTPTGFTEAPMTPEIAHAFTLNSGEVGNCYWISETSASAKRALLHYTGNTPIWQLQPNRHALKQWLKGLQAGGAFLFQQQDRRFLGRFFAPQIGLQEDPVNGNSSAALFSLATNVLGLSSPTSDIVVEQGHAVGRPGQVHIRTMPDDQGHVILEGSVSPFLRFT